MELTEEIKSYQRILIKDSKSSYKMSHIFGIVQHPESKIETKYAHEFLLDTGASISILNQSFNSFIKDNNFEKVDEVIIQYGGSRKRLPVYKINLKIKGIIFPVIMAHDSTLTINSLLGQYGFLNNLIGINIKYKSDNKTKLIWL